MSKFNNEAMNNQVQNEHKKQHPPSVQDVRTPEMAARYESLNEQDYLKTVWGDMKTMFNMCDFDSRRNEPEDKSISPGVPRNYLSWPGFTSKAYVYSGDYDPTNKDEDVEDEEGLDISIMTAIRFDIMIREMPAKYKGSFHIKNAVVRAKFVGDENVRTFYLGEHDMMTIDVKIGKIDKNGNLLALMIDFGILTESYFPEAAKLGESGEPKTVYLRSDAAELEEFTMLAVTHGVYYKEYVEPRAINEDLAIFTHYNKARNLLCDTVASFKDGLVDPETIFTDTGAEDVPASWVNNH